MAAYNLSMTIFRQCCDKEFFRYGSMIEDGKEVRVQNCECNVSEYEIIIVTDFFDRNLEQDFIIKQLLTIKSDEGEFKKNIYIAKFQKKITFSKPKTSSCEYLLFICSLPNIQKKIKSIKDGSYDSDDSCDSYDSDDDGSEDIAVWWSEENEEMIMEKKPNYWKNEYNIEYKLRKKDVYLNTLIQAGLVTTPYRELEIMKKGKEKN